MNQQLLRCRPDAGLRTAAGGQLFHTPVPQFRGCLIPGQSRNPAYSRLLQLQRVGQRRGTLVEHQCDRVANNLIAIQQSSHTRQSLGQFLGIGPIARIDMMAKAEAVVAVHHIAQPYLP